MKFCITFLFVFVFVFNVCSQVFVKLEIDQPEVFVVEELEDFKACKGDTLILELKGDFSRYEWSNGEVKQAIIVDSSGVYTVKVYNENNCSCTDSAKVEFEEFIVEELEDLFACKGDTLTLEVIGNYDRYLWSTGEVSQSINVDSSGVYTVRIFNDNNCSYVDTARVVFEEFMVEELEDLRACEGESLTLEISGNYNSYVWSTGEESQSISIDSSGLYTVRVFNENNCSYVDSATVIFEECALVSDINDNGDIEVFPVPTNGTLNVDVPLLQRLKKVEIVDLSNINVMTKRDKELPLSLDVSALPNGVYFLMLHREDGKIISRKIIIK